MDEKTALKNGDNNECIAVLYGQSLILRVKYNIFGINLNSTNSCRL